MQRTTCCLAAAVCLLAHTHLKADELRFYPSEIRLSGARDAQSVVVHQVLPSGATRDVTEEVDFAVDPPAGIATLKGAVLSPAGGGTATVTATLDGQSVSALVRVERPVDDPPIGLRREVMPVLMKAGCNAGKCHGAARGQNGFHLSLFGYDAAGDHHAITKELPGRRVNLSRPDDSLLLTKALAEAAHAGGQRFEQGSASHQVLRRWISEGAETDAPDAATPVGIELFPPEAVLVGDGQPQRLTVLATYSDGGTRDVTPWAVYLSNNDNSAAVDQGGVIRSKNPGEAFVMARFATFTEGVPVIVLPAGSAESPELPAPWTEVDAVVHDKLRKLQISPSGVCTDEEFLRRVCIDLTGVTPSVELREEFLASTSPDRRAELIDRLIESDGFTDVWTMRLGELLRIRTSNQVSYKALLGFHNWVREQVADNRPLDQLLADVLGSSGGTFDTPPTNYFQIEANTLQLAENVAQTYLGMRIQCAQCHNHPFDRWTMDDYYGFVSFFAQVGFKQSRDPREFIIYDSGQGEVRHFIEGRDVTPKYLGGPAPDLSAADRRQSLADWIVSDDNPAFARNLANIVWAHHFGRGVVDPVDDVRISNPPSNAALLELLKDKLIETNYDLRALVRLICNSRTYQLSTLANDSNREDVANFAKADVRRMRAESLLDSVSQVTDTVDDFPRLPVGARAIQIADGSISNYFLTTFGRAPRETVCACEVDVKPNLSQTLHLINGQATNDKVTSGGVVSKLLEQGATPREVIENLYLRCYSRPPTDVELGRLLPGIDADEPRERLEDVFWALLNSKEFVFNH
ncbi:hypothetical protein KOR34_13560 [Posidoniimonas corsicana]|uniref:Bacterial Ig-like domain (Group 2) n=1 Tax=Posidoniimonas corsicana TaxID=1938618 RepID=A0A5C5VEZ3_9BACT|nr:DUF1549 and DUF1553 domain-containing protein [Posidoniimonas corsicana]TWT36450.1 hypothetical protein KOR34_13560 [Posidoniimonas corsicana]